MSFRPDEVHPNLHRFARMETPSHDAVAPGHVAPWRSPTFSYILFHMTIFYNVLQCYRFTYEKIVKLDALKIIEN